MNTEIPWRPVSVGPIAPGARLIPGARVIAARTADTSDNLGTTTSIGELAPGVPIAACGHSFGSWIAMRAACASPAVDRATGPSSHRQPPGDGGCPGVGSEQTTPVSSWPVRSGP